MKLFSFAAALRKDSLAIPKDEEFDNKMDALHREAQLKKWSRAKKEALIKGDLNKLHELSKKRQRSSWTLNLWRNGFGGTLCK